MDMTIVRKTRYFVVFGLLIVWVFLFGVYAAEAFGYGDGSPEYENQVIEQTLSNPAELVRHVSQDGLALKTLSKNFSPRMDETSLPLCQTSHLEFPRNSFLSGSPPHSTTDLLLSLSILRL